MSRALTGSWRGLQVGWREESDHPLKERGRSYSSVGVKCIFGGYDTRRECHFRYGVCLYSIPSHLIYLLLGCHFHNHHDTQSLGVVRGMVTFIKNVFASG
jgi:hypothetical protein